MRDHPIAQMTQQLPLAISRNEEATFANFCWNNNPLLEQHLLQVAAGNGEKLIYLWGNLGSGKSHLLQACCHEAKFAPVSYLPLTILQPFGPDALDGINQHALIGIDDIDRIATLVDWEIALFHLYNQVRDRGLGTLIITATCPPAQLPLQLPDLKSRLSSGLILQINDLSDEGKVKTLQLHAQKRGFELADNVGYFLIHRCARTMPDLFGLLNQLDEASLIEQRKITIPFVKRILQL